MISFFPPWIWLPAQITLLLVNFLSLTAFLNYSEKFHWSFSFFFLSPLCPTRWVSLLFCKFPIPTHFSLSAMCLAPMPADRCDLISAVPPFSFPAAAEIYSFPALGVFLLNSIKIALRLQKLHQMCNNLTRNLNIQNIRD